MTDRSTNETSTVEIQTLNSTTLKFKNTQYAGEKTYDDNHQEIGISKYYIHTLEKQ